VLTNRACRGDRPGKAFVRQRGTRAATQGSCLTAQGRFAESNTARRAKIAPNQLCDDQIINHNILVNQHKWLMRPPLQGNCKWLPAAWRRRRSAE